MIRIAAVVEGYGDVQAVPSLVAKVGDAIGVPMVAPNPIRAGEWKSIRAQGELERYLELAYRRNCDRILVLLDLEDDCCATEAAAAASRALAWANGRNTNVSIVFFVKEFETIFLAAISDIVADNSILAPDDPESVRDAKGRLKALTGRRYKETQDQEAYTKLVKFTTLIGRSRSFRKLTRELSGLTYVEMDRRFAA